MSLSLTLIFHWPVFGSSSVWLVHDLSWHGSSPPTHLRARQYHHPTFPHSWFFLCSSTSTSAAPSLVPPAPVPLAVSLFAIPAYSSSSCCQSQDGDKILHVWQQLDPPRASACETFSMSAVTTGPGFAFTAISVKASGMLVVFVCLFFCIDMQTVPEFCTSSMQTCLFSCINGI